MIIEKKTIIRLDKADIEAAFADYITKNSKVVMSSNTRLLTDDSGRAIGLATVSYNQPWDYTVTLEGVSDANLEVTQGEQPA